MLRSWWTKLKITLKTENFSQLISEPTRFWPNQTSSLLDHCWTNRPENSLGVRNIQRAVSDHNVITVKIRIRGKDNPAREILIRDKKHFDTNLFKQQIALIDWTEVYNCLDVNSAYGIFEEKYLEKLNAMAPFKKSQVRNRVTPWVSETTTDLMKERNQARMRAAESNLPEDWMNFRLLRNRCSAKIIKD